VNHRRDNGHAALHVGALYNQKECLHVLILYAGANINLPNFRGKTALCIAAEQNHRLSAEYLVKAKANVNLQDVDGNTAMHLATAKGHVE
ncbi:unnamed protein product, partial [Amoebophrya sp. A120]